MFLLISSSVFCLCMPVAVIIVMFSFFTLDSSNSPSTKGRILEFGTGRVLSVTAIATLLSGRASSDSFLLPIGLARAFLIVCRWLLVLFNLGLATINRFSLGMSSAILRLQKGTETFIKPLKTSFYNAGKIKRALITLVRALRWQSGAKKNLSLMSM